MLFLFFGLVLLWTVAVLMHNQNVCSDGRAVELIPGGTNVRICVFSFFVHVCLAPRLLSPFCVTCAGAMLQLRVSYLNRRDYVELATAYRLEKELR